MSGTREIHFEDTVFEYLSSSHLYIARKSEDFNLEYILDKVLLEQFIREAQPDVWKKLEKEFPSNTIDAVANEFSKLREKRGILNLIREGFVLQGASIKLIAFKPSSDLNPEHLRKYEAT
jgi:type I restriction enzyme R subunit